MNKDIILEHPSTIVPLGAIRTARNPSLYSQNTFQNFRGIIDDEIAESFAWRNTNHSKFPDGRESYVASQAYAEFTKEVMLENLSVVNIHNALTRGNGSRTQNRLIRGGYAVINHDIDRIAINEPLLLGDIRQMWDELRIQENGMTENLAKLLQICWDPELLPAQRRGLLLLYAVEDLRYTVFLQTGRTTSYIEKGNHGKIIDRIRIPYRIFQLQWMFHMSQRRLRFPGIFFNRHALSHTGEILHEISAAFSLNLEASANRGSIRKIQKSMLEKDPSFFVLESLCSLADPKKAFPDLYSRLFPNDIRKEYHRYDDSGEK